MSRVGKSPIPVPDRVKIHIDENHVAVEGPKGKLEREIPHGLEVAQEDGVLVVKRPNDSRHYRSTHGLFRSLLSNMVIGVSEGFEKKLRLVGLGYRAQAQGKQLVLNVGFSHPVNFALPDDVTVQIDGSETVDNQPQIPITVQGIDKEQVGHVAAAIRRVKPPEVYKPSKGIRYDGERVRMKEGKARV